MLDIAAARKQFWTSVKSYFELIFVADNLADGLKKSM